MPTNPELPSLEQARRKCREGLPDVAMREAVDSWLTSVDSREELAEIIHMLREQCLRPLRFSPFLMSLASSPNALAVSPDGTEAALAGFDGCFPMGMLLLRNLKNGAVRTIFIDTDFCTICYSPDGRQIAGIGLDRTLSIIDLESEAEAVVLADVAIADEQQGAFHICWSPCGHVLAIGHECGEFVSYQRHDAGWQQLHSEPPLHSRWLAFSRIGTGLFHEEDSLIERDLVTWRSLHSYGSPSAQYHFPMSFEGSVLAYFHHETERKMKLCIFDLEKEQVLISETCPQHSLAISSDARTVTMGGLYTWDLKTGEFTSGSHRMGFFGWAVFIDQERFVHAGPDDRAIHIRNARTLVEELPIIGHASPVSQFSFSADGRRVASQSSEVLIHWDTNTGQQIQRFDDAREGANDLTSEEILEFNLNGTAKKFKAMAVSSCGCYVATCDESSFDKSALYIFDTRDGQLVANKTRDELAQLCCFVPGTSQMLLGARYSCKLELWDFLADQRMGSTELKEEVLSLAVHPDGKRCVVGDDCGAIVVMRLDEFQITAQISANGEATCALEFSPDGRYLASSYEDNGVMLWSFPPFGEPKLTFNKETLDQCLLEIGLDPNSNTTDLRSFPGSFYVGTEYEQYCGP